MERLIGIAAVLTWLPLCTAAAVAQKPEPGNVTVDFRWIEPQLIKGLTEEQGHPIACGGKDWYAHVMPVLTSVDIADARLTSVYMANADLYAVEFKLKDGAVKKLVQACGDAASRRLTVYVNGHWYGSTNFNKKKSMSSGISVPTAGFMRSKSLAEKILQASK